MDTEYVYCGSCGAAFNTTTVAVAILSKSAFLAHMETWRTKIICPKCRAETWVSGTRGQVLGQSGPGIEQPSVAQNPLLMATQMATAMAASAPGVADKKAKGAALNELVLAALRGERQFSQLTDELKAIAADTSLFDHTRGLAVLALAQAGNEEAGSFLRGLVDDPTRPDGLGRFLETALYVIRDAKGLQKLEAKLHTAALSWQALGTWCPYMDAHGFCVQGVAADPCGMERISDFSYPFDRQSGQATGSSFDLPGDTDYRRCPRHQRPRELY